MATVKISNLPQISATATTWSDVIAEVDSGSTTTSKVTLQDLMKNGSLIADKSTGYLNFFAAAGIDANSPSVGAEFRGNSYGTAIIGGNGWINNSNSSFMAATLEAAGGNGVRIENGSQISILSAFRSQIDGGERSAMMAVEDGFIRNSYTNFIAGGNSNYLGWYAGGMTSSVILGSSNGNIESGTNAAVIATNTYTSHMQGGNTMSIIASKSATVEPTSSNAEMMTIINSTASTLKPNDKNQMIINSDSVSIDDSTASQTKIGTAIGAWGGGIIGNGLGGNYQKLLINTYGTQITHGGSRVAAINANGGTISATGDHNMLINTESIDIAGGYNKVTKIGVWDTNHTAQYENTVHTDNIHTYNTESFDVIAGGNVGGSINVDCSTGTIFTFTLTADTTPNFINVRTGQRFVFIVYNNGAWAVPTATVNGSAGTVFAKNGNIAPSNNGYSKYTATYDGTRMFLDEELGFAAV